MTSGDGNLLAGPGAARPAAPILGPDGAPVREPARKVDKDGKRMLELEEAAGFMVRDLANMPSFRDRLEALHAGMNARGEHAADLERGQRLTLRVLKAVADWQDTAQTIAGEAFQNAIQATNTALGAESEPVEKTGG